MRQALQLLIAGIIAMVLYTLTFIFLASPLILIGFLVWVIAK